LGRYRATIKEGDKVIVQDVEVYLNESTDPRSGLARRSGSFYLTPGEHISPGMYRIFLEDGRQGDILVNHTSLGSGGQDVAFIGSGDFVKH